ncbi:MAG: exo-beta-N-acetylmuramidase NamZ family protein [Bacteroidota bacterium]
MSFVLVLAIIGCQSAEQQNDPNVITGTANLVENNFEQLQGKKVGLVTNQSAVVDGTLLIDLLHEAEGVELAALFSPEHGIRGDADAGAHIDDSVDEKTGAPIYSLYGETRKPTEEMLEDVDILVFDMQDVGARFYTYISTMGYTMQAAAENDLPYIVLDRPNPLGGNMVEGFVPELESDSFVGLYPIPVTHGMTTGELAKMIQGESYLDNLENMDLEVLENRGWSRDMLWPDMNLEWIPPSPNIPDFETALIYPGACLFEATHISEGRGTHSPFILIGAPWADGEALAAELNDKNLPGLEFEPSVFTPESIEGMSTEPKLEGEELEGIRYKVTDKEKVEPVAAGIHVLLAFYNAAPDEEKEDFFRVDRLNTLAGSDQFHDMIMDGKSAEEIIEEWQEGTDTFKEDREPYLLY